MSLKSRERQKIRDEQLGRNKLKVVSPFVDTTEKRNAHTQVKVVGYRPNIKLAMMTVALASIGYLPPKQ